MTSLVFTRRVNNDRSNPPRGSRTTVMEEQCVEGSLSNLPIVLREVVLGYLAPEELYIVFKNHLQQQCPAIQRYVKEVTPDYALRYAARTGWLDGLKECDRADIHHGRVKWPLRKMVNKKIKSQCWSGIVEQSLPLFTVSSLPTHSQE